MSLDKLGHLIGHPKGITPQWLIDGKEPTEQQFSEMLDYLKQDLVVLIEALKYMRSLLKKDGVNVKRLVTINQIGVNYLLYQLRNQPEEVVESVFWNVRRNETRRTLRGEEIHAAYRGGKVQVWRYGDVPHVWHVDCRSLYPYAAMHMRFPELRTERFVSQPLELVSQKDILDKIGMAGS